MHPTWKAGLAVAGIVLVGFPAGARFGRPSGSHSGVRPTRQVAPPPVPVPSNPPSAAPRSTPPAPPAGTSARNAVREAFDSVKATGALGHAAMVRRIARRYSVEWKLVMAIIASESGGDAEAVSPVGAVGLMQLMPDTAKGLGVDPYDPEQNVEGAVRYLSSLFSTFGSVDMTLIAYNAGPGFALQYRQGAVELGAETRSFLMRVGRFLDPVVFGAAPPTVLPWVANAVSADGGR